MILACHGISKSFGENVIVTEGSFHIEDHEKAALVGANGAGKTTLFKMIVGELPSDEGEVILTKGKSLGYLAQHQDMVSKSTIYEEVKLAKADLRTGAGSFGLSEAKNEAVEALTALGYSASDALKAVRQTELTEEMGVEEILKAALKHMTF